jgi:OmpA-OmpF porin, OOP family
MKYLCSAFLFSISLNSFSQEYKLDGNEIVLANPIGFKTGTTELLLESKTALVVIKNYLDAKSYVSQIRVEAHTDNTGDASKNQLLTQKRALVICNTLIELGVDCKRLIAVGFGGTKPIGDNSTKEGKAANRRANFFNVALRGRLIGGMPADGGGKVAGELCQ